MLSLGLPLHRWSFFKQADLVDMQFLSLSRFHASQRSPSTDEENKFCSLLRRAGASWWDNKEDRLEILAGRGFMMEENEREVVFGWPTDGVGLEI